MVTAGVVLEAVARPVRRAGACSGRRERVGGKEVRKVGEVRGVEGGGGGEEGLEGGVWRRIRLVDGGREGGDYRIPKNSEER